MKISLKMLMLTLGSFLILIAGIIISLYLYFDQFYEPLRINKIINAMNDFGSAYETNEWSDEQLYSEVSKFMKSQNATMSITPKSEQSHMTFSITDVGLETYDVTMPDSPDFLVLSDSYKSIYDNVNICLFRNTKFTKQSMRDLFQSASITLSQSMNTVKYNAGTTTIINGSIVLYPITATSTSITSTSNEFHEKNGIEYTISTIPYTNYRQVNFFKSIKLLNGETKITSVNLSLQSKDEIMDFLISIFPYMIGAVILLSIIMVIVYSKTITKPIVNITNISNRMAKMEFGIVSKINRKDELGALSVSLNTLSSNLKNSLDELSAANEQLKADYESELRQEKARKEFVANVSHELKTPLGIIKSYSEGIRDGVKSEKKNYYLEVILDEVERMDQLLIEMLEISKFDAGVIVYNKTDADIRCLLEKSVQIFKNKANERELTLEIQGDYRKVSIDYEKVERVVNNLIGNAVKYSTPNSVITISGECTKEKQIIRIINDCEPFTEEVLSKIWDRFYKADASHNRDTDGTGLGLAISKSILEGHDCPYGVYNTDHGVCFYFELDIIN